MIWMLCLWGTCPGLLKMALYVFDCVSLVRVHVTWGRCCPCTLACKNLTFFDKSCVGICQGPWYWVACYIRILLVYCTTWCWIGEKWMAEGVCVWVWVGWGGGRGGVLQLSSQTRNICLICVTCFLLIWEVCWWRSVSFEASPEGETRALSVCLFFFSSAFVIQDRFWSGCNPSFVKWNAKLKAELSEWNLRKVCNIRKLRCGFVSIFFSKCLWLSGVLE